MMLNIWPTNSIFELKKKNGLKKEKPTGFFNTDTMNAQYYQQSLLSQNHTFFDYIVRVGIERHCRFAWTLAIYKCVPWYMCTFSSRFIHFQEQTPSRLVPTVTDIHHILRRVWLTGCTLYTI